MPHRRLLVPAHHGNCGGVWAASLSSPSARGEMTRLPLPSGTLHPDTQSVAIPPYPYSFGTTDNTRADSTRTYTSICDCDRRFGALHQERENVSKSCAVPPASCAAIIDRWA